jgi:integrase/recombinase XerD
VITIPRKRARLPETLYLERDEIDSALAAVPAFGRRSLRDRTLLMFLYNTGARAQEAADLRVNDIQFDPCPLVRLHGKGDKWRSCPIWEETASLLKRLLIEDQRVLAANRCVFTGPNGVALTRFGIYKIVRRHTGQLVKTGADGKPRHVSPHAWRHSTAVHLLESGVEVNVIRAWLGHASLETTNRYAEITIRTKQAALETCVPPAPGDQRMPRKAPWQTDSELLNWLQSL